MESVNYNSSTTPKDYICQNCNASGCKLWRESNCFNPDVFCAACICREKEIPLDKVDPKEGKFDLSLLYDYFPVGEMSDQLGGYIPAVPDAEGIGYWGYTSVPDEGVSWWKSLPLKTYKTTG